MPCVMSKLNVKSNEDQTGRLDEVPSNDTTEPIKVLKSGIVVGSSRRKQVQEKAESHKKVNGATDQQIVAHKSDGSKGKEFSILPTNSSFVPIYREERKLM